MKKSLQCLLILGITFLLYGMLTSPALCIEGAKSGLLLWFDKVLPTLLPFIILINILSKTGVLLNLINRLTPFTKKCFKLSGNSFFIFIMGLIAGYPTGVKLISQLATTRHISPKEAQKNLIFANNCGPLFIIGTVGTILLGNTQLGYFLLLIHFLSAFTMLLLSRFYEPDVIMLTSSVSQDTSHNMAFSEIFTTAVQNGMDTIVYVGAYIIFFSVIIALFKQNIVVNTLIVKIAQKFSLEPHLLHSLVLGSLEMSNGVALLSQSQSLLHLALLSALLAFGGFCVFFQSIYVGKDVNFHWISYIGAKLIQALFAFCYTLLLYPLFFLN